MNISLVQYNPTWKEKEKNLSSLEQLLNGGNEDTDLFLLPEMFSTGFSMDAPALSEQSGGKTTEWLTKMSQSLKSDVAGSIIIREDGCYYNRFLYATKSGNIFHYDKKHLFAMAGEDKIFTPGKKRVIVQSNGFRLNLQVCYDLRFPEWARFKNDYDILIYTANWPTPRIEQWRALLIARAIENQCYVAAVNRVGSDPGDNVYPGRSIIVDPEGKVVCEAVEATDQLLSATIDIEKVRSFRERFPVWRDRDSD